MSNLGYTWYPQDWWSSNTYKRLKKYPIVRYAIRELIDLMYKEGKAVEMNRDFLLDDFNIELTDDDFKKLMEFVTVDDSGKWWIDSVKRRLTKAETARQNGMNGGRPKGSKTKKKTTDETPETKTQKPTKKTNEQNPKNPPLEIESKIESKIKENIKEKYKSISFVSVSNLNEFSKNFEGNKQYFGIAYRFWELWYKDYDHHKTLQDAKIFPWYDTIRLIIEVDNQSLDRLCMIYQYFKQCQQKKAGFDRYWFTTIRSVPALRHTNPKTGVYRLDTLAELGNNMVQKDKAFSRLVDEYIKKFNNESIKPPSQ